MPQIQTKPDPTDPGEFFSPIALGWAARYSPGQFQAAFGPAASRQYSGMSLRDGVEQIARDANISGSYSALMGSSDFLRVLDDATNVLGVITTITNLPEVLKISHETSDIADFQPINQVDGGEFPALLKTSEGGEVKYGTIPDRGETYQAAIYSRMLELTEQALANDHLGMLVQPRLRVTEAVLDTKASIIANLIESNPKLADGKEVFHADHSNISNAGGSLNISTLDVATTAMLRQKQNDGVRSAAISPAYLLVPPEEKTHAEQLVSDITPAKIEDSNPFSKSLEVICEPRLQDKKAWYLFAKPEMQKSLEHGVVNGSADPDVLSERQTKTHSVITRVSTSFAAGWIDSRGAYKNSGS